MTIADFIAGFLEKRRKKYEERYKSQNSFWEAREYPRESDYYGNIDDQLNDVLRMFGLDGSPRTGFRGTFDPSVSFNDKVDDDLDGKVTRSNIGSFFNKRNNGDSSRSSFIKSGMSQSSKIVTRPDGTVQVETITKDSNGNVERRVSYKKGDKVYTVITKTDGSGNQKVEENVSAADDALVPSAKTFWNSTGDFNPGFNGSDSGYDYWYNKFFKKDVQSAESAPTNPFGFTNQLEQQIERMLKTFKPETPLDSFNDKTWKPANGNSNKKDANMKSLLDDFIKQNGIMDENNPVFDEMRKFLESAETSKKGWSTQRQLKDPFEFSRDVERKLNKMPSSFFSKKPSLFHAIDQRSKLEFDENPPFDSFVEEDEERLEKLKPFWERTRQALEGLNKFFHDSNKAGSKTIESDAVENNQQLDLLLPEVPVDPIEPKLKIFKKPFTRHSLHDGYLMTQTVFSDGKMRKESVKRADDGTIEKVVTYTIGDKSYVIDTKIDRFGEQHKVKKHINMNEDDVKQFAEVWRGKFKSDFEE